jgi:hypothetical protein
LSTAELRDQPLKHGIIEQLHVVRWRCGSFGRLIARLRAAGRCDPVHAPTDVAGNVTDPRGIGAEHVTKAGRGGI